MGVHSFVANHVRGVPLARLHPVEIVVEKVHSQAAWHFEGAGLHFGLFDRVRVHDLVTVADQGEPRARLATQPFSGRIALQFFPFPDLLTRQRHTLLRRPQRLKDHPLYLVSIGLKDMCVHVLPRPFLLCQTRVGLPAFNNHEAVNDRRHRFEAKGLRGRARARQRERPREHASE